MKQKFFSDDRQPKCEYCENGRMSPTGLEVFCPVKGVVALDYSCKKYIYDPLKRRPSVIRLKNDFSADDFKL